MLSKLGVTRKHRQGKRPGIGKEKYPQLPYRPCSFLKIDRDCKVYEENPFKHPMGREFQIVIFTH